MSVAPASPSITAADLCGADGGAHELGQVALVAWEQVQLAAVRVQLLKHALVVL